jgi:hypothetical protein
MISEAIANLPAEIVRGKKEDQKEEEKIPFRRCKGEPLTE